jgi:hypothetical protein
LFDAARVRQLPLINTGASPSRPTIRWHRRIEEIRLCAKCGRQIIVRRTMRGEVVREFMANGLCLNCFRSTCG